MRAGLLRHRVLIQTPTAVRGNEGGFKDSWDTLKEVWARIEPIDGDESERSSAQEPTATHKITMRYHDVLSREKRLLFGTEIFNIRVVLLKDKIKDECVCLCTQRPGVAGAAGSIIYPPNSNIVPAFESELLSFLTVQSVTFNVPSGRVFFPERYEIYCEQMNGVVSVQPTVTLGIPGTLEKYKAAIATTQLTVARKRQPYSTLLAGDGETQLVAAVSIAGALSSGTAYKGRLIVKGTMP